MSNKLTIYWDKQLIEGVEVQLPRLNLDPLVPFEKLRNQLTEVDSISGPLFMRDLNRAFEQTALLAAKIEKLRDDAVIEAKHQKAAALLERAPDWLNERKIKVTDKARESYADMDYDYKVAAEKVNALTALAKFMGIKAKAFQAAHDDAKKIYDRVSFGAQNKGVSYEGGYSESDRDLPADGVNPLFGPDGEELK